MSKAMAIVAIVGAVLAGLMVGNLSGDFVPFPVMLLLLAAAIVYVLNPAGRRLWLAILLFVLAFVPLLYFTVNGVGGNGKTVIPDVGPVLRIQILPVLCLVPLLLLAIPRRNDFRPTWLSFVAFGLVALVLVLALVTPAGEYGHVTAVTVIGGIAALATIWPISNLMMAKGAGTTTASGSPPRATPASAGSKTVRK